MTTYDQLRFVADVDIEAAADSGKPATVDIHAYGGGILRIDGRNHVIDLQGIALGDETPLLTDHQNDVDHLAGSGKATSDGRSIRVRGHISRNSTAGAKVIGLHRDNVKLRASVGVAVNQSRFVAAGESLQANGQTLKAPAGGVYVAAESELIEVSLLPIGADRGSSVSISASKGSEMSTAVDDQLAVERERAASIYRLCASFSKDHPHNADKFATIAEETIEAGDTVDSAELAMLRASRATPGNIGIHRSGNRSARFGTDRDVLECGLLLRAGAERVALKHFGEEACELAAKRDCNIVAFMRATLAAHGRPMFDASANEIIRAGFSTIDVPVALSNVANKSLAMHYAEAPASWRLFASIEQAKDFKTNSSIRPSTGGQLEEVGPGGEIHHDTLGEDVIEWSVGTYAKQLMLTRTDIINDDLKLFDETPAMLSKMAMRRLSNLVWSVITTNAGDHFGTDNANLLELELSATNLAAAVEALRSQRDENDNDIDLQPHALIVGPANEAVALAIVHSTEVRPAEAGPTGNAMHNIATPKAESRLANTVKFPSADPDSWYLFSRPSDRPIIVGFLRGNQVPIIEVTDPGPNYLGAGFRCYHDFGVALGDPRAGVLSVPSS